MRCQITDVTPPLNSVRVCDQGNNVLFTWTGRFINHVTCPHTSFLGERCVHVPHSWINESIFSQAGVLGFCDSEGHVELAFSARPRWKNLEILTEILTQNNKLLNICHVVEEEMAAGVSHDSPRTSSAHISGLGASNTTKIPREDTQRSRRGEKKREILGLPPSGPHRLGPPLFVGLGLPLSPPLLWFALPFLFASLPLLATRGPLASSRNGARGVAFLYLVVRIREEIHGVLDKFLVLLCSVSQEVPARAVDDADVPV